MTQIVEAKWVIVIRTAYAFTSEPRHCNWESFEVKLILTYILILWSTMASAQDHRNPVVQSIVDWHRQYCYDNLTDLRDESRVPLESDFGIDEGSIYDIEIAENQTATVVYKSFTCEGEGHGWCGSGGCGYFIVVGEKIFERQLGYEPKVVNVPVYQGSIPAIVVPMHGTSCEGAGGESMAGADTCFAMATWNEYWGTFQSIVPLLTEVRIEDGEWTAVVAENIP
ncbi:hypothetical protein MWN63_04870 [Paradonghicola geojensis]|nr:hypothetical protein [Marivivens geojensis]